MTFKLNDNSHIFLKENTKSKDYLVSVVIGSEHYKDWKRHCLISWQRYTKKNNLGILVINKNLLDRDSKYWKSPTWQRLLIANYIEKKSLDIRNICVLDSDIFINELAPNIFKFSNLQKLPKTHLQMSNFDNFYSVVILSPFRVDLNSFKIQTDSEAGA